MAATSAATSSLLFGDCIQVLRGIPDEFFDAVVTDPPYGLEFMGREWDGADGFRRSLNEADVSRESAFGRMSSRSPEYRAGQVFQQFCETWARECLRVLKPGGHLLAFGGTRTYHRLAVGIEDAGFDIRDSIKTAGWTVDALEWVYGSGMPKAGYLSYALERTLCTKRNGISYYADGSLMRETPPFRHPDADAVWGMAGTLSPKHEPIIARKPVVESLVSNAVRFGIGGFNVDACRVPTCDVEESRDGEDSKNERYSGNTTFAATPGKRRRPLCTRKSRATGPSVGDPCYSDRHGRPEDRQTPGQTRGRWPANLVLCYHPECQPLGVKTVRATCGDVKKDAASVGMSQGAVFGNFSNSPRGQFLAYGNGDGTETVEQWDYHPQCAIKLLDEQAEVSRFFPRFTFDSTVDFPFRYASKVSRNEREQGLPRGTISHPTLKPIAMLRWLIRLVVSPGALILDPFVGAGSTVLAAIAESVNIVGIEKNAEYAKMARRRIDAFVAKQIDTMR